jgi:catechol 2,3-dioxygenase-like lactoylglutathione lyase family enzyme
MLGPILAVTAVTHSLDKVEAAYGGALGYSTVERSIVSPELAAFWGAPKAAGRPMLTLAPRTEEKVLLRFVENPAQPSVPSNSTLGWNVMEINVGELDALAERLKHSPFAHVAGPATLGMNAHIRAMQVRGPDEEVVYLTEVLPSDQTNHLPQTKSGVGRLFIAVLGVSDIASTEAFYKGHLGQTLTEPASYPMPLVNGALGLPPNQLMRMSLMRLPGKFSIEIDEMGAAGKPRPHDAGDIGGGIVSVSFAVAALDDVIAAFAVKPAVMPGAPYDGARAALITGPSGERLELIEHKFA